MATANDNSKPTWHHWWMTVTRHIFIAPNEVGVVYRHENFHRWLSPGYHPHLSSWNERLAGRIRIFMDKVSLMIDMHSQNGFAFKVAVTVRYLFNPTVSHDSQGLLVAAAGLSRSRQAIVQEWVTKDTQVCVARQSATYSASALLQGQTRLALQQKVSRDLRAVLDGKGIVIDAENGVIITAITPPDDMAEGYLEVYKYRLLMEVLQKLPPEQRAPFLVMQLTQKDGPVQIVDAQLGAMLGQIYQAAGISPLPTAIHLNGQKPTRVEAAAPQNGHAKA